MSVELVAVILVLDLGRAAAWTSAPNAWRSATRLAAHRLVGLAPGLGSSGSRHRRFFSPAARGRPHSEMLPVTLWSAELCCFELYLCGRRQGRRWLMALLRLGRRWRSPLG